MRNGVFRIPLPLPGDGLRAVNVYLLETSEGPVMVDGGWALTESRQVLEKALRSIGYEPRDVTQFFVTHAHRDHYTMAVAIRQEFRNAKISLGVGDRPTLDYIQDPRNNGASTGRMLHLSGAEELARRWDASPEAQLPSRLLWEMPDQWLVDSQMMRLGNRDLLAVSTPGHTQGHFVFAEQDTKLLFAGDHVLPTLTPSVGFEVVFAVQPLIDFLESLAKVRAMPDMLLLPAHGHVAPSVHKRVDELLAHHEDRLERCRAAVDAGYDTAHAVAEQLPWTNAGRRLDQLDLFNAMLATLETLVHLRALGAQGRIASDEALGVLRWRSVPPTASVMNAGGSTGPNGTQAVVNGGN